jgi:hypothetical protein
MFVQLLEKYGISTTKVLKNGIYLKTSKHKNPENMP